MSRFHVTNRLHFLAACRAADAVAASGKSSPAKKEKTKKDARKSGSGGADTVVPKQQTAVKVVIPQGLVERVLVDVVARAAYGSVDVKAALTKEGFDFDWDAANLARS